MAARNERMDARIPADVKALLQRAAALQGLTLTEFMLAVTTDAARRVIHEHEIISLSLADSEMFLARMENPPKPNAALRAAAARLRRLQRNRTRRAGG